MKIRAAKLEDAPAIAHAHVTSWRAAYPGIVSQTYLDSLDEGKFTKRWQGWITTEPDVSIGVAEVDNTLCGFAAGGPIRKPVSFYDGELYAIYLLPTMQRKGVGRELVAYIGGELAARGISHFLLWTLRQNPSAAFYERLGGELIGEDVEEIGGESLPVVAYGWANHATRSWR